jgi:predicted nucleotidyltransferase
MQEVKAALLSTLAYSDLFDYPLTKAELWRYLVTSKRIQFARFSKELSTNPEISQVNTLFCLKGRKKIITLRQERKKISEKKIEKAKQIATILSRIPTIELIGISGSVAMLNAEKDADIDLFIITKSQTLWITRLLILIILESMHLRRKRQSKKVRDTFCLNMMIDTTQLQFQKNRHDMYTAHEILQMKPLFARGFTYHEFLRSNKWIAQFMPNGFPTSVLKEIPKIPPTSSKVIKFFEPIARLGQVMYSKRHMTTETIHTSFLAFHPFDYKNIMLEKWEKRKKAYGI